MNIILFKGLSQYQVVRFFIEEVAQSFKKLGHNAIVIDLLEKDYLNKFKQSDYKNCDFFFSFNGIGLDLKQNDDTLFHHALNTPFVTALLDHPCHNIERLNTKINNLIVTCVDKCHLDYLTFYYPEGHIKLKSFLPHGGSIINSFEQESLDVYLEKRTIPLLFAGSFSKLEKTWINFSPNIVHLLDDTVDCLLSNESMTLDGAFYHVFNERGVELDYEQSKKMYFLFPEIDKYIRGYMRQSCLKTLGEAGLPIVLCGKNWDNWLRHKNFKTITYLGELSYQHLFHKLQQTRLSLNSTPNFIWGSHERDFNAMLNGAVSVAQFNFYYNKEFTNGKNIVLYKLKELDNLPNKIAWLLENPEITRQIAQTAKLEAEAQHTWFHRAQKILDMVLECQKLKS